MAYTDAKDDGDEQEAMYRFLTPGDAEHQQTDPAARECMLTRKFRRLSLFYTSLVTPEEPMGEPPACRLLASCLVIAGFATGTALVILLFYVGFAYDLDEGIMFGMFALGGWSYGLVTYCRKTSCFQPEPTEPNDSTVDGVNAETSTVSESGATSRGTSCNLRHDPPSYKEVMKSPPSYTEAVQMMIQSTSKPTSVHTKSPVATVQIDSIVLESLNCPTERNS